MTTTNSTHGKSHSAGSGDRLEKRVYEWLADVGDRIGAERVGDILSGAMVGAAKTKATLDKNLESLLAMANIPSRAEFQKLKSKVDSLQGSIMNLSRKVDELARRRGDSAGGATASRKVRRRASSGAAKAAAKPTAKATAARNATKKRSAAAKKRAR